jgi:NAD(P)H dehydrogenase (quinone)
MTQSSTQTLLVTGGSGQLGRRVIDLLLEANAGHVVTTTRTPEKLSDLAARGVEVRQGDFNDPDSLAAAFAGADRLLLISTDVLDESGTRLAQHRNAVATAVQAGVKHVVYTSLANPEPGSPITIAGDHYGTEQALANSPLDWTILRNNVYTDTLLMSLPQAIASGQLVAAAGEGGVGYVTREDCARVAAAALAGTTSGQVTLDVTGPEVVTYADLARMASEFSGRPVSYISVSTEDMVAGMMQVGLPPFLAEALVSFHTAAAQGDHGFTTSVVADLTGTAPQSVGDFLLANREALIPSNQPS